MSAWVLPDHIADVLPSEARHIEELRRLCLDTARSFGYELVQPPLLEYLQSLLAVSGQSLNLQTFKLVDQISGRTLGLRADTTPQVARIDAHLLNRHGVTRLCYCGPVLHTRPDKAFATREPLQFGAEIYGHAGLEADAEVLQLALQTLAALGLNSAILDLSHAGIMRAILDDASLDADLLESLQSALAQKDASGVAALALPADLRETLLRLLQLYGGREVLTQGRTCLARWPSALQALDDLQALADQFPQADLSFDLADLRGYDYYSGARFALYVPGATEALVRGGRYDQIGAAFGRKRPAVGFSFDLKALMGVVAPIPPKTAIRAPWGDHAGLREAIESLRASGETVVCTLPGHPEEDDEFEYDRELVDIAGQWCVRAR
ncbi:MAG: ATP phosphoribosyltransferase regulatory subunit [Limnohabitans sp.]|nr:ATP phosphoribosyltransferase regulatory subunit [Limnohabitans sp.]